jgi:hypothetical protein
LPDAGIIVTHREFLANTLVPRRGQLFVCVVADFRRHPFAQLHVVQNPRDPMLVHRTRAWRAAFLPHWPESSLIPRDPMRGDAFANVSYFGMPARLAPQLRGPQFAATMREHGFNFRIVDRDKWNDYSDTDAVLAVRSFARLPFRKFPPTKLYNSWVARVPALLGPESAYQAERRGPLDYFEVGSVDAIVHTLARLRADPTLRAAVVHNADQRAADVAPDRIAKSWAVFLTTVAVPAYHEWRSRSTASRAAFLLMRLLRYPAFVWVDFVVRAVGFVRKQVRSLLP